MTSDKDLLLNLDAWRRWNQIEPETKLTADEKIEWLEGFRELIDAVARGNSTSTSDAEAVSEKS